MLYLCTNKQKNNNLKKTKMDSNLKLRKLTEDLQNRIDKIREDMHNDYPSYEELRNRRLTQIETLQSVLDTITELEHARICDLFPNGLY